MAEKTECNYDEMKAITTKLNAEAEAINQLVNLTRSKVEELHGQGWIGQAADAFFSEMESLVLPSIARLAGALQTASTASTEIAGIYHDAEGEAQASFNAVNV